MPWHDQYLVAVDSFRITIAPHLEILYNKKMEKDEHGKTVTYRVRNINIIYL